MNKKWNTHDKHQWLENFHHAQDLRLGEVM